ncbi:MAG: ribonuclease HII [Clostridiales bacterium]|nr:ribonuclease HII [Clostridia bacterium]MCR5567439.1 ribonuclease HII [Clostridiales bacterium]
MAGRELRASELMAFDLPYKAGGLVVAGMDEVGRGPLAGPVVTACVVMPEEPVLIWVDDSKKLSESRREKVYEEILNHALYVGIGEVSPEEIDEINILEATRKAMRMAASEVPADVFLIDAVTKLGLKGKEVPIIKGDATSYSIAAASIVAKVTRDRQMISLDSLYPEYGFARNKGYGTREHIDALKQYGPCPVHRQSFITHFV